MPKDFLSGIKPQYDVIVIGSGLAGMTAANILARCGHRVLLLEQHYKLGGLATWFRRPGGHIFDISLHGFPVGMIKSCRRYWGPEIAQAIVQLRDIRFDNPMFRLGTTFDRNDFVSLLLEHFRVEPSRVEGFFRFVENANFFDDCSMTTGELFEQFFPGRPDIVRFLLEPITYANGSTLEDPAIAYSIVFSNFMSRGVFTFRGGTDHLIEMMAAQMRQHGVDLRIRTPVDNIVVEAGQVKGVVTAGRVIRAKAVISNAHLISTCFRLIGREHFSVEFTSKVDRVRLNNSSTQVYIALKPGEGLDRAKCGDLLFRSTAPEFRTDLMLSRQITSRTYSFYYPETRPGRNRSYVVSSTNARYEDWACLSREEYSQAKQELIDQTLADLERYVPDLEKKVDWVEAATPLTFERYTGHPCGASFGTKFEGLAVSRALPQQMAGMFHTGSVGIIMSGWLGAVNYGVIVANEVDAYLTNGGSAPRQHPAVGIRADTQCQVG